MKPKLTRPSDVVTCVGLLIGAYAVSRTFVAHELNVATWVLAVGLLIGGMIWHVRSPRKNQHGFLDSQSRLKL